MKLRKGRFQIQVLHVANVICGCTWLLMLAECPASPHQTNVIIEVSAKSLCALCEHRLFERMGQCERLHRTPPEIYPFFLP